MHRGRTQRAWRAVVGLAIGAVLGQVGGLGPAGADPAPVIRAVPAPASLADPGPPDRAVTAGDLPALQAALEAATSRTAELADELDRAAAEGADLRRAAADRQAEQADAQARLDLQVRSSYISGFPPELSHWTGLTAAIGPDRSRVLNPGDAWLADVGRAAAVGVSARLLAEVSAGSRATAALVARSAQFRAGLRGRAAAVLIEQDRARQLLATAQQAVDAERAVADRLAATRHAAEAVRRAADIQHAADIQRAGDAKARQAAAAQLAQQAALDAVSANLTAASATVTQALSPVLGAGAGRTAGAQAVILRVLLAAGSGYPAGYGRSSQALTGTASWYGPGFVGLPTASGAAYDPELLTCASKELPLGTVLHVSTAGLAVNCLVNDRGPYVGDRILDLSRAGSRALAYDGTAEVTAEVLTPL